MPHILSTYGDCKLLCLTGCLKQDESPESSGELMPHPLQRHVIVSLHVLTHADGDNDNSSCPDENTSGAWPRKVYYSVLYNIHKTQGFPKLGYLIGGT